MTAYTERQHAATIIFVGTSIGKPVAFRRRQYEHKISREVRRFAHDITALEFIEARYGYRGCR